MDYKIGKSSNKDVESAIDEATAGLISPKLIIFLSGIENFEKYTVQLKEKFKDTLIMGATTFAALCRDGAFKNTLLVLGINSGIECYGDILEDADRFPIKDVEKISAAVGKLHGYENTVCFELCNGYISCEEIVLSTLKAVLSEVNIPIFGGTAGNNGTSEETTLISYNGRVLKNSCVFMLIKNLGGKVRLYKENIYKPTDKYFTATEVDFRGRTVYEYNEQPAVKVMADALKTTVNQLPQYLDSHPLGRIVGNDLYITANKAIEPGEALSYHARINKNSHMVLLELDNYKEVNKKTIEKIKAENSNPSLSIMVNCLGRSMMFEKDNYLNTFCKNMGTALQDYVGITGYGEQLNSQHFNQTMVVAVFE